MAAVLESITIPRCSAFRSSNTSPSLMMASSVSSISSTRKSSGLSEFSGLKLQLGYQKSAVASAMSKKVRVVRRGDGAVCEAQETALEVPSVTDKTWKSLVTDSDVTVLVEFWAPWCGPCRMIHPVIGELSKQYAGKLNCYKLNTDECPSTATLYGIRSIPTVMIFKGGEKKDAVIGAVPKTTLTTSIEKYL
ncbi:hypothetical protein GIB67_037977 [Kingdonia uniflora]|uniref:Thioredoxin domain-containing protein n=1 Tax=Kingdonia uniflora TaxID=39325 RepID=A0A7J7LHJ0_9MAGN|nr:hypothetical protein GIB67_037977 [Kingdonia uniflora]